MIGAHPVLFYQTKKTIFGEFEKDTDYHHAYAFKHGGGRM